MSSEQGELFGGSPPDPRDLLRAALERGDVTLDEIADRLAVTEATVRKWLRPDGPLPRSREARRRLFDLLSGDGVTGGPDRASPDAPRQPMSNDERVAKSMEASSRHRHAIRQELIKPWAAEIASPEIARPAGWVFSGPVTAEAYVRPLRRIDVSPLIFGSGAANPVPFDESTAAEFPQALWRLRRLRLIDYEATLKQQSVIEFERGPRPTTRPRPKRLRGGLPGRLPREVTRAAVLLDRGGPLPGETLAAFASPNYPTATDRALALMLEYGLVEFIEIRDTSRGVFGRPVRLYQLTKKGFKLLVKGTLRTRRWSFEPYTSLNAHKLSFLAHHVGAVSWTVRLLDTVAGLGHNWYTPAWSDAHLDLPSLSLGGSRQTISLETSGRQDRLLWQTTAETVTNLKPDVVLWVDASLPSGEAVSVPLLVEYDLTEEVVYNLRKIQNWEAWRIAVMRFHELFTGLGDHLGALVVVMPNRGSMLALMEALDQGYTSRSGERFEPLQGNIRFGNSPAAYYPGRANLYFALEEDVYNHSARVFQIPPVPPKERSEHLGQPRHFVFHQTTLLPALDPAQRGTQGRLWRGLPRMPKSER